MRNESIFNSLVTDITSSRRGGFSLTPTTDEIFIFNLNKYIKAHGRRIWTPVESYTSYTPIGQIPSPLGFDRKPSSYSPVILPRIPSPIGSHNYTPGFRPWVQPYSHPS